MPNRSPLPARIPPFTVLRFARYLNFLSNLPDERTEISSAEMARVIGIKATQLRQDFFTLGGFGRQGRKYDTRVLKERLREVLYLQQHQEMVLVGAGNLGQALANYRDFERFNLFLRGIFDNDSRLIGTALRGIVIQPMDRLPAFVREQPHTFSVYDLKNVAYSSRPKRLMKKSSSVRSGRIGRRTARA